MGVVLPVYNEAATIERSVAAVCEAMERYPSAWRVIAVDDGSADDSAAILRRVAESAAGTRVRPASGQRRLRRRAAHRRPARG